MTGALTIPQPQLPAKIEIGAAWLAERDKLAAQAATVVAIGNQAEYTGAEILLKLLTAVSNDAEKMRKEMSDPFNRAARDIKAMADGAREPLEAEKARIKAIMGLYLRAEQIRQQEEMMRKAQEAEAQRQADEARLAAERDAAIAAAKAEADPFAAAEAQEQFVAKVEAAEVAAPIVPDTANTRRVMSRAKNEWRFEVLDVTAVPREFCCPDERKIREHVNRNKDAAGIAGVRIWEELAVSAR